MTEEEQRQFNRHADTALEELCVQMYCTFYSVANGHAIDDPLIPPDKRHEAWLKCKALNPALAHAWEMVATEQLMKIALVVNEIRRREKPKQPTFAFTP